LENGGKDLGITFLKHFFSREQNKAKNNPKVMAKTLEEKTSMTEGVSPAVDFGVLSPELIAKVQSLYDEGLFVQAHDAGCVVAPLERWQGVEAAILAGRVANNLGAFRIGMRQHVRAYRAAPEQLQTRAYHLELILTKRGPIFA
jgi:hypothetical protein